MIFAKHFLFFSCATLICACSATVSSDDDNISPQTYSELGKCNNSNKGEMVYLSVDDERYLCDNGEWKQLSIIDKKSSSSKTDDKKEDLSSSSKKGVSTSSSSISQEVKCDTGYLCDSRDGKKYKITIIGDQTWMAENLNHEVDNSYCYDLANAYCDKYGRLYEWKAAMAIADGDEISKERHQGVCPTGWHIPSYDEYFTLVKYIDENNGDEMIKWGVISKTWNKIASDLYGFSILPAGERWDSIGFKNLGENATFWSSALDEKKANIWGIRYGEDFQSDWEWNLNMSYSVRCIKD